MTKEAGDIKVLIREFLEKSIKNHHIDDADNFFELGYCNSLFALQLVVFIEKKFTITIEDEELDIDNFNSINAMNTFIGNKILAATA